MQELVETDVLIVAKSNFSYYAGLMSDGIKIFEPCGFQCQDDGLPGQALAWCRTFFGKLDGWISCGDDGSIDRSAFERRMAVVLQEKAKSRAGAGSDNVKRQS